MLRGIKDYVKCAVRNKFIMGSYVGIGGSLILKYIEHKTGIQIPVIDDLMLYTSPLILGATQFGLETVRAYRKMRTHIEEQGTIEPIFKEGFSKFYCTQTGIRMAAEEAGLEKLI